MNDFEKIRLVKNDLLLLLANFCENSSDNCEKSFTMDCRNIKISFFGKFIGSKFSYNIDFFFLKGKFTLKVKWSSPSDKRKYYSLATKIGSVCNKHYDHVSLKEGKKNESKRKENGLFQISSVFFVS
jgi:hypothetical protein